MSFFEKVLLFLDSEMTRPTNYGWFHILAIAVILIATLWICLKFKDCDDKIFRRIALVCWLIMVALEIYKQVIYSFHHNEGVVTWDYPWYIFPFQFCSTPLYVLPFVAFLKNGKIRDALIAYSMTFALFGGLVVYVYPNDVFTSTIGINIQTMVHHGLQILLGVFFAVHSRKKLNLFYYLRAIWVFGVLILTAIILNEVGYQCLTSAGLDDTFNMFYISPYFACHLPILSSIYEAAPYPAFLCLYAFGFVFVSFVIYCIEAGITRAVLKGKNNA